MFKSRFKALVSSDERRLALKFALVSCVGLAVDVGLLRLGLLAGVAPALARVVSLFCAMQATFLINGLVVFKRLDLAHPWRPWAAYMAAGGVGNFCNYWLFVTLVSTHWPVVASPLFALGAGSFTAWLINYCGARLLVFRGAAASAPPATMLTVIASPVAAVADQEPPRPAAGIGVQ